jgi:hypothetical protein
MSKQTIQDVTALRLEAKSFRRDAQKQRDAKARVRLLKKAESALTGAISMLQRELRVAARQPISDGERGELRELLSSTIGSLGGTYRDAKDYDRAIQAYDEGNVVEETRRREDGHLDSYNLVQRLVVRLLKDQTLLADATFRVELETVDRELDRQHELGRRDSWFLADVILIKFLRGKSADEIFSALESKEADKSFYESTVQVVGALLDEGLGRGGPLEESLLRFRRMLQRRGGLKAAT